MDEQPEASRPVEPVLDVHLPAAIHHGPEFIDDGALPAGSDFAGALPIAAGRAIEGRPAEHPAPARRSYSAAGPHSLQLPSEGAQPVEAGRSTESRAQVKAAGC